MGDRVYFVSALSLGEVAARVGFASEVHKSESLNDLIQRRLKGGRAEEIAEYLVSQEQRFFNALVVGVYAGDPTWQDFGSITPEQPGTDLEIPVHASETFGFLRLSGSETLFALDGQHRLAGIRRALTQAPDLASDRVGVIFVAHESGETGLQRTRRLFTVLNKTARPVLKGDIIALDEDDLMAICTRRLLDESEFFAQGQVAMRLRNSLPPNDKSSWTTVTMVYDLLTILFKSVYPRRHPDTAIPAKILKRRRAPDETISLYYTFAHRYFELLAEGFDEVASVLTGDSPGEVVPLHRHAEGGHVLYRPLGQRVFTELAAVLGRELSMEESVDRLKLLPTDLAAPPYRNLIWDPARAVMLNGSAGASLLRDLLLLMLGEKPRRSIEELQKRYAGFLGVQPGDVDLPEPVV